MLAHNRALIGLLILSASVWVGSLVCLVVVSGAARSSLDPGARVAFFRSLGRRYGLVGDGALVVAIGVGLAMGWPPSSWDRLYDTAVALTGLLVIATALGIRQARAMTRLRRQSLTNPGDAAVATGIRQGTAVAIVLRSTIGVITLAIVAVAACIIGS